jgi:phage baseplate assembly protein W
MNTAIGPKLPLTLDPKNGFLMIDNYVDETKQNLKILVLTAPGERVFDLNFGVGLRNYLFENKTSELDQNIRTRIYNQVEQYLPYVNINDIVVGESPDTDNLLYVKIDYFIIPLDFKDQITIPFIE